MEHLASRDFFTLLLQTMIFCRTYIPLVYTIVTAGLAGDA